MEINKILDNYKEVATYIEDNDSVALLGKMKSTISNGEYYLPFIGQFTAGKSKLINHLIGIDLLPTKSTETTAFLTYIKYGSEQVVVEYQDKTTEEISISQVKEMDYMATKSGKAISTMTVCLPIPLLENGLIIVDTPGVNTLVSEHVAMTETLLENSQYIVYVLGMSPQNSDIQMIKKIYSLNIPVIFARTHIDLINDKEMLYEETISQEKNSIEKAIGREIDYYQICNNENAPNYDILSTGFEMFEIFIGKTLSSNISDIYKKSVLDRLSLMKEKFVSVLNSRREQYDMSSGKSIADLDEQLRRLDYSIKNLERNLSNNTEKINRRKDMLQESLQLVVPSSVKKEVASFKGEINTISKEDYKQAIQAKYQEELPKSIDKIGEDVSTSITNFVTDSVKDVQVELKGIKVQMQEIDVTFSTDYDENVLAKYASQEQAIEEDFVSKYNALQELNSKNENELVKYGISKDDISSSLEKYDQIISDNKSLLDELNNSYQPVYVEKKSQLGKIMKGIGFVGDLAMLLVPATGWASAAKTVGHTANALSKGGKVAQIAGKALVQVGKAAKAMSKADMALDATKIVNGVVKAQNPKTNFFDYFSLSFWMEKMGESIDPSTMELDQEYENQYIQKKNQIESIINANIRAKLEFEQKQGMIKSQTQRIQRENALREEQMKVLDQKLSDEKNKLDVRKEDELFESYKKNAVLEFEGKLNSYAQVIAKRSKSELVTIAEKVLESTNQFVLQQLEQAKSQITEIKKQKESNENSGKDYLQTIDNHIKMLNYD